VHEVPLLYFFEQYDISGKRKTEEALRSERDLCIKNVQQILGYTSTDMTVEKFYGIFTVHLLKFCHIVLCILELQQEYNSQVVPSNKYNA
jgi:hypothetical protein